MKWILIFLTSVNGEISVEVVDTYAHMAECYYEKTIRDWDIVTANEKYQQGFGAPPEVCFNATNASAKAASKKFVQTLNAITLQDSL